MGRTQPAYRASTDEVREGEGEIEDKTGSEGENCVRLDAAGDNIVGNCPEDQPG